jgi:hypothetical protein
VTSSLIKRLASLAEERQKLLRAYARVKRADFTDVFAALFSRPSSSTTVMRIYLFRS